jgi:hypothetical protein
MGRTGQRRRSLSEALEFIADGLGLRKINTGGHHATGMALLERVWGTINKQCRIMTLRQFRTWSSFAGLFMLSHNSQHNRRLECSPHESHTGRPLRTASTAVLEMKGECLKLAEAGQTRAAELRELTHHFRRLAQEHQDEAEAEVAALNRRGRPADYVVGETVAFYRPLTPKEAPKHTKYGIQWRAPATVLEVLDGQLYKLQDKINGREYTRHVSGLKKYRASEVQISPLGLIGFNTLTDLERGVDVVLRTSTDETDIIEVGRIYRADDTHVWVHYWYAHTRRLSAALWLPVYMDTTGLLHRRASPLPGYRPYLGEIPRGPYLDDLIILRKVRLRPGGKLPYADRKEVAAKGYKHARTLPK